MYVIGIDPGKRGGIAVMDMDKHKLKVSADTPLVDKDYDPRAMRELLLCAGDDSVAYIEKQSGFHTDSRKAVFTTGYGYGIWISLLRLLGIPTQEISPREWQSKMGISKSCYGDTKKASLKLATAYFPGARFNRKDGRSDAVLIGVYGDIRRRRQEARQWAS